MFTQTRVGRVRCVAEIKAARATDAGRAKELLRLHRNTYGLVRTETLRRLEDEQQQFREFLGRLRMAKDKAEFDQFMADGRT